MSALRKLKNRDTEYILKKDGYVSIYYKNTVVHISAEDEEILQVHIQSYDPDDGQLINSDLVYGDIL